MTKKDQAQYLFRAEQLLAQYEVPLKAEAINWAAELINCIRNVRGAINAELASEEACAEEHER